jgi:hypothetical protein
MLTGTPALHPAPAERGLHVAEVHERGSRLLLVEFQSVAAGAASSSGAGGG